MSNRMSKLLFNLNIDYNDFNQIHQLALDFEQWCWENKSYETIEVMESKHFDTIIVVHQLFDDEIRVIDGWEFIKDVKYLLKQYSMHSNEDLEYVLNFWGKKIKRYNEE